MTAKDEHLNPTRMCEILDISRTEYYRHVNGMKDYDPRPARASTGTSGLVRERVRALAEQYPLYGHKKIQALLRREGNAATRYAVLKIMREEGLLRPSTWRAELRDRAKALKEYLVKPSRPMELLQADITYVPIDDYGMHYVIDVMDYYSRYNLVTLFSDTQNAAALMRAVTLALEEAARLGLRIPTTAEIELGAARIKLLTDNGPAMISTAFKKFAEKTNLQHLRTKNHRPETNGCIERFHGTLKYEEILGAMYHDPITAAERINAFRRHYNEERIHQALGYKTPLEVIDEWLRNQPETPLGESVTQINAA